MLLFVSSARLLVTAALLCCLTAAIGQVHMTKSVLTKDSVVQFLNHFEEIAEKENFDLIQGMVHDNAFFRFNDRW